MRPVPTKWETSRKISFESYKQIHDVQTLSFKMICNIPGLLSDLGSKTHYFLEKFLCFLLIFEMFNEPYLLKLPGDLSLILWEQVSYGIKTHLIFHFLIHRFIQESKEKFFTHAERSRVVNTSYISLIHLWYTPTKQGTSRTGLFWELAFEVGIGVKNDSFVDFEIFRVFYVPWYVFYHLHVISAFQTFFHKKILHFLQPVKSKAIGIGN